MILFPVYTFLPFTFFLQPTCDTFMIKTNPSNKRHYLQIRRGFPGGTDGKESVCNTGDLGLIPELGRYPGEGNGNPL